MGDVMLTGLSQNKKSPKWTFAGRCQSSPRLHTPGPGAYTGDSQVGKSASWGFGTASRDIPANTVAPGPGQYMPQDEKTKSTSPLFGFGSSERKRGSAFAGATPGPGTYVPNYKVIRQDTPKFTAAPRREAGRGLSGTPGPGTYHAEVPNSPKGSSPEWGFGTSPRQKQTGNFTPGPGTYQSKDQLGAGSPKFTMRSRSAHALTKPSTAGIGNAYSSFGY